MSTHESRYQVYRATPDESIGEKVEGGIASRKTARIIAQTEIRNGHRHAHYIIEHQPGTGNRPVVVETVRP